MPSRWFRSLADPLDAWSLHPQTTDTRVSGQAQVKDLMIGLLGAELGGPEPVPLFSLPFHPLPHRVVRMRLQVERKAGRSGEGAWGN